MDKLSFYINYIVSLFESIGPVGGFLLIMLESVLPPLPLGVIVGFNMISFGKLFGFILSYVATIIGCILSFVLFRYFFKGKFINKFSKKNRDSINKWKDKLSNIKMPTLALLVALPVTPSFAVNIAAGLSDMSLRKFIISICLGKPAMLFFYGYIAVSVMESLKDPMNIVKVIVLMLVVYIISKIIEKVVKVDE